VPNRGGVEPADEQLDDHPGVDDLHAPRPLVQRGKRIVSPSTTTPTRRWVRRITAALSRTRLARPAVGPPD